MTQDQSVLAAQRAEDQALCDWLRFSDLEGADGVATRIEQLGQELCEACHDRDRFQADCERLSAELATRPRIAVSGTLPIED